MDRVREWHYWGTNIGVMGVLEGQRKDRRAEKKKMELNNSWKYPKFDEKH